MTAGLVSTKNERSTRVRLPAVSVAVMPTLRKPSASPGEAMSEDTAGKEAVELAIDDARQAVTGAAGVLDEYRRTAWSNGLPSASRA